MMKKYQFIVRIMMAVVVMFGVQTTVNAQIGSLVKKAKSVADKAKDAKEAIDAKKSNEPKETPSQVQSSQAESQSDNYGSNEGSKSSSSNSNLGGYKTKFDVDLSKARHSDWDYTSGGATVEADFAYWMQRLINSMSSGNPDDLDWEAAGRINTGKPSFDFLDKTYHLYDEEKLTDYHAEQWQLERKEVLKRLQEIESIGIPVSPNTDGLDAETKARKLGQYMVTKANAYLQRATKCDNAGARTFQLYRAFGSLSTGVTMKWTNGSEEGFGDMASTMKALYDELPAEYKSDFPVQYDISSLRVFDEQRKAAAKNQKPGEEVMKMKKGALLTQYRTAQKKGETASAFSGHVAWLENGIKENCPEWGTPIAARVLSDYKVEVNALGTPLYRTFTAEVICEDQGFRVFREVFLKQDYAGGKYGESEIRPGGLKWNGKCRIVK